MANCALILLSLSAVFLLVGAWWLMRRVRQLENAYKRVLESTQQRLDQQSSRINILTRALPNLQSLLSSPQALDTWKNLCLDEARALIWADGASYWRFIEKDQTLELDVAKGSEAAAKKGSNTKPLQAAEFGSAGLKRVACLVEGGDLPAFAVIPLVISGRLWGVFRFVRREGLPLGKKDLELVSMFIAHLGLLLENRDMVLNLETFYLELVQTLAETLDSRDASSDGQSRKARELARSVARQLELPEEFIYYLEFAALMHDIGKIAIDEGLLKKPGKLTDQEFALIKKHPEFGHKILLPVTRLAPVAPMVLYHQEWFNGKGYPEGLSGEEIPLGARIVAVLDAWGAMTSDRPWRKALTTEEAIAELRKNAGTQFDPQVVEAFVETITKQGLLVGR